MQKHAKTIFWNAMLLTLSSFFLRTVGVGFQVYLSNRIGAEAMGLFSLTGGVYAFALTLATSGIHLGVTRIVVDSVGSGKPEAVAPAMRRAVAYALCFGVGAFLLLFVFSEQIGSFWLKDTRTVPSLRLFAITLPLLSVTSAIGGYFSAVRRVWKSAAVQVTEQLFRMFLVICVLLPSFSTSVEQALCAVILGGTISEILSFLLTLVLYLPDRKKAFPRNLSADGKEEGRKLISISLPVALTAYLRSGLITLEHILIPEGLRNNGSCHAEALIAYGSIHSMALPVILYPAALISSFSGLLIPEFAESRSRGFVRRIPYMISRVWSLSMAFSIGVAGFLLFFSEGIGECLYPETDAAKYIRILAPLIPIMYIDTATDCMMKGLGEQVYTMGINLADAALSVVLVWLLIPRLGISGYLITIYFSEIFNTIFSIAHLLSVSKTPPKPTKWVWKPLLSVIGAAAFTRLLFLALPQPVAGDFVPFILPALAMILFYGFFLFLTGAVEKEDVVWIKTLFPPFPNRRRTVKERACETDAPQEPRARSVAKE